MTAKSEWLNGFEAGKKSVSGGYRHRIQQLEAKLDAVSEVESYSIELQDIGRPATVMLTKDVLLAIGEWK